MTNSKRDKVYDMPLRIHLNRHEQHATMDSRFRLNWQTGISYRHDWEASMLPLGTYVTRKYIEFKPLCNVAN